MFAVSSLPARDLPDGRVWDFDKLIHGTEYAILAVLWVRVAAARRGLGAAGIALVAAGAAILTGAVDELYQSLIPGRDSSAGDLLADGIGACLGASLATAYYKERSDVPHP